MVATAFSAAAHLLLARGQPEQAQALLTELDETPAARANAEIVSALPDLVRTTLTLGDLALAHHFVAGVEPRWPAAEHALVAARAQLSEAAGDHKEAATLYADAAEGWRRFGNVPERAYALLGQGRCILAVGDPGADGPLAEAGDLFASMGYKPALAEAGKLLAKTIAKTA